MWPKDVFSRWKIPTPEGTDIFWKLHSWKSVTLLSVTSSQTKARVLHSIFPDFFPGSCKNRRSHCMVAFAHGFCDNSRTTETTSTKKCFRAIFHMSIWNSMSRFDIFETNAVLGFSEANFWQFLVIFKKSAWRLPVSFSEAVLLAWTICEYPN